jgi:hypothetical protein
MPLGVVSLLDASIKFSSPPAVTATFLAVPPTLDGPRPRRLGDGGVHRLAQPVVPRWDPEWRNDRLNRPGAGRCRLADHASLERETLLAAMLVLEISPRIERTEDTAGPSVLDSH